MNTSRLTKIMNHSKHIFTVAAGVLTIGAATSNTAMAAPTPTTSGTVALLENGWYGEGLAVTLQGVSMTGCTGTNLFGVKSSHPNFQQVVSLLLAAQLSGRSVVLVVEPTSCVFGGAKELLSVRLAG